MPLVSFGITRIQDILNTVKDLMELGIPILILLGLLYFLYGLTEYIFASEEGGKADGRNRIIYGIVGLFVMATVWGLVQVLAASFGVSGAQLNPGTLPTVPDIR